MDDKNHNAIDSYREVLGLHAIRMWDEWMSARKKKNIGRQSWTVVPKSLLIRVWEGRATLGFVRDEAEVDEIVSQLITNTAKLQVNTTLLGHTAEDPYEFMYWLAAIPEDMNKEKFDSLLGFCTKRDFGNFILDDRGQWRISDQIQRTVNQAIKLVASGTADEKIVAADKLLNMVHQRGDLAASFVEGGSFTLSELSSNSKESTPNPPPKGSPTDLNLWVLDKFFSDKDEVPNRIDPTDVPHLRRCMSAGLIEAVAGPYGKRGGALRLTEKGKQAIREWSLGKNPEDTRVTESNPTMFAYRVHFFDGWNGKNRSMDTTAPSPAKAISNVRYRIAAERGIPLATMPRDMYSFKRVEQLG